MRDQFRQPGPTIDRLSKPAMLLGDQEKSRRPGASDPSDADPAPPR